MAGRYLIPVSRFRLDFSPLGPPELLLEHFPADTLAIPLSLHLSAHQQDSMVVLRTDHLRRKQRTSRPRPMFRVLLPPFGSAEAEGRRLELIPVGERVLIHVSVQRPQVVQRGPDGFLHIMLEPDVPRCASDAAEDLQMGRPTCPHCLACGAHWEIYYIQPYDNPDKQKREKAKEARARRAYARRPSVFDKLLGEDILTSDPLEPPPFQVDPESIDETEDYRDPRESRRMTAQQNTVRHEAQKQAIRAELRDRRRVTR